MNILGISALYHDSAAALCCDGEIVAAASEERFSRKKADASIPKQAIEYCLGELERREGKLDAVVYYDNPLLTLDRWLSQCIWTSPDNEKIIEKSFLPMVSDKLWVHKKIQAAVGGLGEYGKLLLCEHHVSHAASAFYPSPFEKAAILTVDGVGEYATTTIGYGEGEKIKLIKQLDFPHSLGLLYSAFTYFCGFKVNSGEYKLMGLAPYGEPIYYDKIRKYLLDIKEDGSFHLNVEYFAFMKDNVMTDNKFEELFGLARRVPEERITKPYMDMAASIQKVTEEIILKLARHAKELTGAPNLVMAGGTALNCVANGQIVKEKIFDKVWIQPAAGDAGGALGAALYAEYNMFGGKRIVNENDSQQGSYLGPEYSNVKIAEYLKSKQCKAYYYEGEELFARIAEYLAQNCVVGVFNGRMEFGPRALGSRSIIANPMSEEMQAKLNLKIKFRESFRPFAPAVIAEREREYFDLDSESPYMLLVAPVNEQLRVRADFVKGDTDDMITVINQRRSSIPAVTHVDYSARVQTVNKSRNPYFYQIIKAFEKRTGCGVVVNTSFNVRGEPIVCTPDDAYQCFMRTDMDVLVMENYLLLKEEQPVWNDAENWRDKYVLD